MDELQERIAKEYGYGVCDAYSSKHCVDRCQDHKDCGAKPIPIKDLEKLMEEITEAEKDFIELCQLVLAYNKKYWSENGPRVYLYRSEVLGYDPDREEINDTIRKT